MSARPAAGVTVPLPRPPGQRRLRLLIEPRDLWVGLFVSPHALYFCPLPMLVLRWDRRP